MATFPSKANYVTGEVLTATNMNDIGGAINLLESAQFAAGKNKVINGDFGVWQRGTSFSNPASNAYLADRFFIGYDGSGITRTVSQQTFTPGTAPVAGYEGTFFLRDAQTVAGTGAGYHFIGQAIEDVRTFAGQTVTISFWAKADSAKGISVGGYQNFGSGGSSAVGLTTASFTLTTSWVRYTSTIAIPSIAGKTIGTSSFLRLDINLPINQTSTIDIWGVQMEAASTASNFQTATGTKQGELAACQRYLPAFSGSSLGGNLFNIMGFAYSATAAQFNIPLPVTPRVRPTGITISALSDFSVLNQGFASGAPTAITFNSGGQILQINTTTTAATPTLVTGQTCSLALSGANGLFLVTGCEL